MCVYPLSAAQRRLWFIAALDPESWAYNSTYVIHFDGRLDVARLVESLQRVVARHESLRMNFSAADSPDGEPLAYVSAPAAIVVPSWDLSDFAEPQRAPYQRRLVTDFARLAFDLSRGPLLRAALLSSGPTTNALVVVVHHIVFDRWSFGVLCRELATLYGNPGSGEFGPLPPLRTSYGQCSQAELADGARTAGQLAYWRMLLGGEPPVLELPADRARPPVSSDRGAVTTLTLEADLVARVGRVGAACRATPFTTFFAAFVVLLQRYSGQTDIIVGTPVAGRGRLEREPLIGLFVNTLPLRVRTTRDETFDGLLATVRGAVLDMLAHADVPFDRLVQAERTGRESGRNPFFDVLFNFHTRPVAAPWPADLRVRTEDVDLGTSRFDFAVVLRPEADGSITCRFEYRLDLFEPASVAMLATHFAVLLDEITREPHASIERIPLATATEIAALVNVGSRPAAPDVPLPLAESAPTLHGLIERSAALRPAAIALIDEGRAPVTFSELDRQANRLAHRLRARGVDRDVRVGILLDRSTDTIVVMLATLKAGGAYVPLDPAYPHARVAAMLTLAGVRLVVTCRANIATAAEHDVAVLVFDDGTGGDFDAATAPRDAVRPDDLAYVMFTSGSTGTPKAVAVTHRGVVSLVSTVPELVSTPGDVAVLHAPLTFDLSTFCWVPLAYGARVAIMPPGPLSLAEFGTRLVAFGVTVLELSAAIFHQLVEERLDDLRGLRRCVVGGDVLSPLHSARFVNAIPGCRLYNGYGPTETTVIALLHEVGAAADTSRPVPIGLPIGGARVYILDARQVPVPIGVPGELWIGGDGVARGYLNDVALTAERFVPDPFAAETAARMYRSGDRARRLPSGAIEFLGRTDDQVKIRGFRIEPAEIEFALLAHPAVRNAAVAVRGTSAGDRQLIAYADIRDGAADEPALRAFLQAKLPPHAVPARIVILGSLPLTSSGKLDRLRLPDPNGSLPPQLGDAPRSEAERTLAAIVSALLGIASIGRNDDFFVLGGHSLLATRVIARIANAFGVQVPLRRFFGAPTVAGLAELVGRFPRAGTLAADSFESEIAALSASEIDALLAGELADRAAEHGALRAPD